MYYVPCFLPLRYVYCLEGIIFYLFFNIYFLRTKYYGGLVTKSCPTLVTSQTSPPGSPVHGILQARTLEWVAICFSRTKYHIALVFFFSLNTLVSLSIL